VSLGLPRLGNLKGQGLATTSLVLPIDGLARTRPTACQDMSPESTVSMIRTRDCSSEVKLIGKIHIEQ
jgi:hypothetical protein